MCWCSVTPKKLQEVKLFLSVIWGESVQRTCHHEGWQHTFTHGVNRTDSNSVIDTKPAAIVSAQVKNIMRRQCRHGDKGRPIRCVAAGRLLKNTRVCCAAIVTSAALRKPFSAFLQAKVFWLFLDKLVCSSFRDVVWSIFWFVRGLFQCVMVSISSPGLWMEF